MRYSAEHKERTHERIVDAAARRVHHRGQLTMLARQAGGIPSSSFGPGREMLPLRKSA